MPDKILHQRHPDKPNILSTRKGNEEAAIHDPSLSATSEYNRKSKKDESRKITRPPRQTHKSMHPFCTPDRSEPTYLPPHNLRLPPSTKPAIPCQRGSATKMQYVEPFVIPKPFLTPSLMESMTCNTNSYAALETSECLQGGRRKRKEVFPPEFCIWLGIVVNMGVHNSPAVGDYWRPDGLNPTHPISKYIDQTRFEEIMRCLFSSA